MRTRRQTNRPWLEAFLLWQVTVGIPLCNPAHAAGVTTQDMLPPKLAYDGSALSLVSILETCTPAAKRGYLVPLRVCREALFALVRHKRLPEFRTPAPADHDADTANAWRGWLEHKAQAGDPFFQTVLADLIRTRSPGFARSDTEAVGWLQKAAAAGYPRAYCLLGRHYYQGRGVARDEAIAVRHFRLGIARGSPDCMEALGLAAQEGRGVPADHAEAARLFCEAGELGNVRAIWRLAQAYANGQGVAKDLPQAVRLQRMAAELGCPEAQVELGHYYENGLGLQRSHEDAIYWYKQALAAEHPEAERHMGQLYYRGRGVERDYAKALVLLLRHPQEPEAQRTIGHIYARGGRGVEQDCKKAERWYRKAALADDHDAMLGLANLYAKGLCLTRNYPEALAWCRKAAEAPDEKLRTRAWRDFAVIYQRGLGSEQDASAAARHLQRVSRRGKVGYLLALENLAEEGIADAQFFLGEIHYAGLGRHLPKDRQEALYWYMQAAKQNHPGAKSFMTRFFASGQE